MEAVCNTAIGLYGAKDGGFRDWAPGASHITSSKKRYQDVDPSPMVLLRPLLIAGPEEPF